MYRTPGDAHAQSLAMSGYNPIDLADNDVTSREIFQMSKHG